MAFQDLVGQALGNAADVLKARYNARAGGTAAVQDASLSAVDRQSDAQARAGSYTSASNRGVSVPVMVGIAAAALLVVVLLVRK